jgi:hypothetical protein
MIAISEKKEQNSLQEIETQQSIPRGSGCSAPDAHI